MKGGNTTGRGQTRWHWRLEAIAGLVTLIVSLSVSQWHAVAGGVSGSAAAARPALCLPGRAVPIMNSPHVSAAIERHVRYNSLPPTSGPHFPFAPAVGVYAEALPNGLLVHALEHGHIVIVYAQNTPAATVKTLTYLARRYPADVLLAPYPALPYGIALTAWSRIELQDSLDQASAVAFIRALRGRYDHRWTRPDPC
jgi:hypothetical protein